MFANAQWQPDRMLLDGLLFRLEQNRDLAWRDQPEHFRLFKTKELIDAYAKFFARASPPSANILELGLWDGGSLAFWFEMLRPQKMVGLDIEERADSDYFRRYVATRNFGKRISTYWGTNQADVVRLRQICECEFDGPLDLVFDDASHLYTPTKVSFETLFPLLRAGGFYVIEDWAWAHWRDFVRPGEWSTSYPPTKLVMELIAATGTGHDAVANIEVFPGFVAIERGTQVLGSQFRVQDIAYSRPDDGRLRRVVNRLMWGPEREALAKLKRRIVGESR
jgi:hypothetical protein